MQKKLILVFLGILFGIYNDAFSLQPLHQAARDGNADRVKLLLQQEEDQTVLDEENGWAPIHWAAAQGHLSIIEILLEAIPKSSRNLLIHLQTKEESSALHLAAKNNKNIIVLHLLQQGAQREARDKNGWTPLHHAVQRGHETSITELLEDLDITEQQQYLALATHDGDTALHIAIANNKPTIIRQLLQRGAQRDARDKKGWTPLHFASRLGHEASITLLLEDLDITEQQQYLALVTHEQLTALHIATASGKNNIVRPLLQRGAQRDARNKDGWIPLHLAARNGDELSILALLDDLTTQEQQQYLELTTNNGWPALHIAAGNGKSNSVRQLLQFGAKRYAHDKNGWTPLHWAARNGNESSITALLDDLTPEKQQQYLELTTNNGWTPLHIAASDGKNNNVRQLLQFGAKRYARDNQGGTPLHWAARNGNESSITALLDDLTPEKQQQYLELITSDESTTLHLAAGNGKSIAVKQLLQLGANRYTRNKDNCTPLHFAAQAGDCASISALLDGLTTQEQQQYLELTTNKGSTALHIAAAHGKNNFIRQLLQLGAKRDARSKDGETPLHWAAQAGDNASISALLDGLTLEEQQQYLELTRNDGSTALHIAAAIGNSNCVKQLLQLGANRYAHSNKGWTPLHCAARAGDYASISTLLDGLTLEEQQQCLELTRNDGSTALHMAAYFGKSNAMHQLIDLGIRVDTIASGHTILHAAVLSGNPEMVSSLLNRLSPEMICHLLNIKTVINRYRQTVLHFALKNCTNNRTTIVKMLLQAGANCTLRDSEGKTPQKVAEDIKDEACTQAIINHQINTATYLDNLTKWPSPVILEAGTLPGSQDTNQAEWYTPESLKMAFEATHKDDTKHELYNCSTRLPLTGKPFQIKYLYSYLKQLVGNDREDWLTADNLPTRLCIDPLSLESHLVPYATARRLVADFLLSGQRVWSTKFNQVRSDILNASACKEHSGYYRLEQLHDETQKVLKRYVA